MVMIAMALRGGAKSKIGKARFGKCRLTITPPEFSKVCEGRIFRKKKLAGEDPLDPLPQATSMTMAAARAIRRRHSPGSNVQWHQGKP